MDILQNLKAVEVVPSARIAVGGNVGLLTYPYQPYPAPAIMNYWLLNVHQWAVTVL